MNNQFLQHLNSITPQGRAKDTKIFIPAEELNEEVKKKSAKKVVRKLKKTGRSIKRAIKGLSNILSTPQDNVDYMMTGRKF